MVMLNNQMVYTNEHSIMMSFQAWPQPGRDTLWIFQKKTPRGDVDKLRCPGVMDIPKTVMNMGTWLNIL
jgi:hypothetical protein